MLNLTYSLQLVIPGGLVKQVCVLPFNGYFMEDSKNQKF